MLRILPESKDDVLVIGVSGKLNVDDYEKVLIPKLEELFKAHNKLHLLIEFADDFAGWASVAAAWDDAKIGLKHPNDFDKLAFVGAPEWAEWGAKFFSLFTKGEVRNFPADARSAALKWIAR